MKSPLEMDESTNTSSIAFSSEYNNTICSGVKTSDGAETDENASMKPLGTKIMELSRREIQSVRSSGSNEGGDWADEGD